MRGSALRLGTQVTGRRREGLWPEARGQVSLCTKSGCLFCFLKNPLLLFFIPCPSGEDLEGELLPGRWITATVLNPQARSPRLSFHQLPAVPGESQVE